ncbi:MAG: tyrosine-type recombinase/integrase [Dehalococcoidia bacterium]
MGKRRANLKWSEIKMSDLELTKLLLHFSQTNKAERKSERTIAWYPQMIGYFVKFLESNGIITTLGNLNARNVREFLVHEQSRGLSPFTVAGEARSLKAFSSWLLREGYTAENVLATIKVPKTPSKIIEPLISTEIETLLQAENPLTAYGSRNIALLTTLLDTGLRCSEISGLALADAHIDQGYLKVKGKGDRERYVPLGALAQKLLWRYVFHFRPEPVNDANDFLFLSLEGKCLQSNAIKLLLKRWGKKAGVPRLHAHLCRHTYATNFLTRQCGDVFMLKQILGHSTLEMVNRYVHYASSQALIQSRPSSPVDLMNLKKLRGYKVDQALRDKRENNS